MTFWKDKNVLCLGGAGFVAHHLIPLLLDAGVQVEILDNFSRGSGYEMIDKRLAKYGDCSDEGTCRDHFKGKDVIFNLAAHVASVIYNQSHHVEMFEKNLFVQSVPLKIATGYEIPYYLATSSVCVYSPDHNAPALEVNGFRGRVTKANEGYSMAKRVGENIAEWYAQEYDLHVVRVRPSNIIGSHDYFDDKAHVVPALIKKCLEDDPVIVNGTGYEEREFIYVTDVARGMMAAVEHGKQGEVYNLGTNGDTCVSIRQVVQEIQDALGVQKDVIYQSNYDPGDAKRWSNARKAHTDLGWSYQITLREGIQETVKWYLEQIS